MKNKTNNTKFQEEEENIKRMETNKVISNKWKCRKHPTVSCDFICLEEDAKDRVVCFKFV